MSGGEWAPGTVSGLVAATDGQGQVCPYKVLGHADDPQVPSHVRRNVPRLTDRAPV